MDSREQHLCDALYVEDTSSLASLSLKPGIGRVQPLSAAFNYTTVNDLVIIKYI